MIKIYSKESNSEVVCNFIKRRKKDLRSVFHSKCCLCNFSEVQEALEFHHVHPEEKSFAICSSNTTTKALRAQLEEMKKCILVCANCHRGIHYGIYQVPENWKDFYDNEIAQSLLKNLEKKKTYCKNCGKEITNGAEYCKDCIILVSRTVERPSREILKNEIRNFSFVSLGKKYGVTDNAIRKWCISYGLPKTKKDINSYSDTDWKKI